MKKDLITENLDEIERIAEEVIKEYGSDYETHAELGVRFRRLWARAGRLFIFREKAAAAAGL